MTIYKITNIQNNKVYIGKCETTLEERWQRHVREALDFTLDTHFARAIRHYGVDSFNIEAIDTATTSNELCEKEKYWIAYYDSCHTGYNMTMGGDEGNTYLTKNPDEMETIKEKIRKTKIGSNNPNSRAVKCKNVETNQELHFNSIIEMQKFFQEDNHQFIVRRCRHEIQSLYKELWAIAYEEDKYFNFSTKKKTNKHRQVEVVNLNDFTKSIFSTMSEASRFCGFSDRRIKDEKMKHGNVLVLDNFKITILN